MVSAASGYIVADDRYVLRFVSVTIPDLYKDAVDGIPALYVLYDYRNDPGERSHLVDAMPEKAEQLKAVWKKESANFPKARLVGGRQVECHHEAVERCSAPFALIKFWRYLNVWKICTYNLFAIRCSGGVRIDSI